MKPQELANSVWAWATLRYFPGADVMDAMLAAAGRLLLPVGVCLLTAGVGCCRLLLGFEACLLTAACQGVLLPACWDCWLPPCGSTCPGAAPCHTPRPLTRAPLPTSPTLPRAHAGPLQVPGAWQHELGGRQAGLHARRRPRCVHTWQRPPPCVRVPGCCACVRGNAPAPQPPRPPACPAAAPACLQCGACCRWWRRGGRRGRRTWATCCGPSLSWTSWTPT